MIIYWQIPRDIKAVGCRKSRAQGQQRSSVANLYHPFPLLSSAVTSLQHRTNSRQPLLIDQGQLQRGNLFSITSPSGSVVKIPPAKREMWVQSLGQEDPLETEMATHCNILAWEIPWIEEPCRLQYIGQQSVRHDLATKPQQAVQGENQFPNPKCCSLAKCP